VTPRSDAVRYQHFGGPCYYLHLHPEDGSSVMVSKPKRPQLELQISCLDYLLGIPWHSFHQILPYIILHSKLQPMM